MKLHGWVAGLVLAGGVVFAMRGCLSKPAPDERLAGRLQKMCTIARDNVDTPERGVRTLGHYLGDHIDDVLSDWGATIATIEKIPDDKAHDDRARLARERLLEPLHGCERDWNRFFQAVEADPKASELVQHAVERLGRTFEIIFQGAKLDLRDLPRELGHAVEDAT
jgi:hypothetical protein